MNQTVSSGLSPHDAGYLVGYYAGQLTVFVLVLAGIWKCISISRRPTCNAKCAWSLAAVLATFLCAALTQLAIKLLPPTFAPAIYILLGLVLIGLAITSIILAIIGLVECSEKKDVYVQGKAQAIWTLVLSAVLMVTFLVGFIAGVTKTHRESDELTLRGKGTGNGETVTFKELNFQVKTPAKPWVRMDVAKVNKLASFGLLRSRPQIYMIVIAENSGISLDMESSELLEICKNNLRSAASAPKFVSEFPETFNGLRGMHLETDTKVSNLKLHYLHWVVATNGYAYQLIFWGKPEETGNIRAEAKAVCEGFSLLDTQHAASPINHEISDFHSTNFLYRVHLKDSAWQEWDVPQKDHPNADFGVLSATPVGAGFTVIPLRLAGLNPSMEAVGSALLALYDVDRASDKLSPARKVSQHGWDGLEYEHETSVDKENYLYRFRILRAKETAFMLVAWVKSAKKNFDAHFDETFARFEPPAPDAAFPAPETYPPHRREQQGILINSVGLFYYNQKQYSKSVPYFEAGLRLKRDSTVMLGNIVEARTELQQFNEALQTIDTQPASMLTNHVVQAMRGRLQMDLHQNEKAIKTFRELFDTDFHEDDYFINYLQLLQKAEKPDDALAAIDSYLKTKESLAMRLWQSDFLNEKEEYAKSIEVLKAQREKYPFDANVGHSLVSTYCDAKLYQEGLNLAEQLIKDDDDSANIIYLKGRSQYGLKWYREAKTSFEQALKKAPDSEEVKSFLAAVSGMLGEGSNSTIKEEITPVAIPKELLALPVSSKLESKDFGAHYLKRITAISFQAKKEFKTTDYCLLKLLDQNGVTAFSSFQIPFDPLSEKVFVNQLIVKDEAGKTVSTGNVSDYYVLDQNSELVSQKKTLNIPVSGLAPGYQIELTYTHEDFSPPETFSFVEHPFGRAFPVAESILFVRGDIDSLRYESSPKLEPKKTEGGLVWKVENPLVYRWEPLQQTTERYMPHVWLGSKTPTWESEANTYFESIRDRQQLTEEQIKLAAKLTETKTTSEEKIRAIASYVQTNLTYKGIEFGRRARIPQKTSDIVRNKYGDCKDHALLLQQMLEAVKIPARLALVNSGGSVIQQVPSLDQFNHMIVYLPSFRNGFFIDCTAKENGLLQPVPTGLAGQPALVLDGKNPKFVSIPGYPVDSSRISSQRHLRVTNDTDLSIEETVTLTGYHGGFMRMYLKSYQAATRKSVVLDMVKEHGLELEKFQVENLDTAEAPLILKLSYLLRGHLRELSGQMIGRLPALWERHYLTTEVAENRLTPFEVFTPLQFESVTMLDLPKSWRLAPEKPTTPRVEETFASWTSEVKNSGEAVEFDFRFSEPAQRYASSQYADYRKAMEKAIAQAEVNLVLSKKADPAGVRK